MIPRWGHFARHNNKPSREILGLQYHSLKDTLRDSVDSMIKVGFLKDMRIQPKL